jgi:hypothetical protein
MKKRVLLCLFVLLVPIFSQAKDTGRIQGQVMKAGKPVGGVDVILMELSLSTITDKYGVYLFTRIPSGKYTLVFTQGDNVVTISPSSFFSNKPSHKPNPDIFLP